MERDIMPYDVFQSLRERLNRYYDTEVIRRLARLFGPAPSTRKEDRLMQILKGLEGDGLKWALDRLDDITRKAVAEAAYDPQGRYDPSRFQAKYGKLPKEWSMQGNGSNPFFGLFIVEGIMPEDLGVRVRALLPRPPEMKPRAMRTLPEKVDGVPLTTVHTGEAAQHDIMAVLHLVAGGMVTITSQRQTITARAARLIAEHLAPMGDSSNALEESAKLGLRAGVWANILLAAGLAREGEKRLELTDEGRNALTTPPHDILRAVWKTVVASDHYKQTGESEDLHISLYGVIDVPKLRGAIIDSLARFPIGEWIETAYLVNYLKAANTRIIPDWISRNRYYMFSGYHERGYDPGSYYSTILETSVLTFLRSLAATMGIVDMAYPKPSNISPNQFPVFIIHQLKYVRVTPLGAYCMGITDNFAPAAHEPKAALKVLPTLDVVLPGHSKKVRWEMFFLDRIAERTSDHVWKLDRKKVLDAMEREGITLESIREVLSPGGTPLPDTVVRFLEDIRRRETALRFAGAALLFETRDEASADLFVHERKLQGLCLRAGAKTIAVPEEKRREFLRTMKKMGYLVRLPEE